MWTVNFFVFLVFTIPIVLKYGHASKIHPTLLSALENEQDVNIFLSFVGNNEKVLKFIENRSFLSRADKITTLKKLLEQHTFESQTNVQQFLKSHSIPFTSYWISNQIFVKAANQHVIKGLASFPEVKSIHKEALVTFPAVTTGRKIFHQKGDQGELWHLHKIQAHEAWKTTDGNGAVAGIIDSGVRHTHEALRNNFRGIEYGWFEPETKSEVPFDWVSHGTHVTGTVAGRMGIGVAPGATWIHCGGCPPTEVEGCREENFIACSEWMLCPTKPDGTAPDCSMAPNLVSNSWGFAPGAATFEPIINAWVAANIVPVFAVGNAAFECNIVISPADSRNAIGVANTQVNDYISDLSSAGPANDHMEIKPDLCAPGHNIISASNEGDDLYTEKSGSSMATPTAAGAITLLLSLKPNMTFAEVKRHLTQEGVESTTLRPFNRTCGGIADSVFPNYVFGYGRINALKIVQAAD